MQIVELDAQSHIVQSGKLMDQVEALENKADIPVPAECPLFFAHPAGILAHELVRTGRRPVQQPRYVEERGFPGTGSSGDCHHLSPVNLEGHVL